MNRDKLIFWLKQQETFFINNINEKQFFLDLAKYFKIIQSEEVIKSIISNIYALQQESELRLQEIDKKTEGQIEAIKKELDILLGKKKNDYKKKYQEYENYKNYNIGTSNGRLISMFHALRFIFDDLYFENKEKYEKYYVLSEDKINHHLKHWDIINNYEKEKENALFLYNQSIAKAYFSLSEVHLTIYRKEEIEEEEKELDEIRYSQKTSYKDREKYLNYFSPFTGVYANLFFEMEFVQNPEKHKEDKLFFNHYFNRELFLRHFLKVNMHLVLSLQYSVKNKTINSIKLKEGVKLNTSLNNKKIQDYRYENKQLQFMLTDETIDSFDFSKSNEGEPIFETFYNLWKTENIGEYSLEEIKDRYKKDHGVEIREDFSTIISNIRSSIISPKNNIKDRIIWKFDRSRNLWIFKINPPITSI